MRGWPLLLLVACQDPAIVDELPPAETVDGVLVLPEGFPLPNIPESNPITTEGVELGRYLFYDTRLSGNEEQSCGSCHFQELAFTDGLALAEGSTGMVHPRNSNALTNAAYNSTLTWANPVLTDLETQFLVPIFGEEPVELGVTGREDEVLGRFLDDPEMVARFEAAYPNEDIDWDTITKGLASFVRTMISGNSRFDDFTYRGDSEALTEAELRGMGLFYSEKLECHHCHGGFNFSEASVHENSVFDASLFHNTGLYNIDDAGAYPPSNTGVYEITGDLEDMGRFRPPSLRNVAVTAPYMHDGSMETLEEVIKHYERGGQLIEEGPWAGDGRDSPLKSGLVPGFELTDEERADLIAFLEALTDPTFLTRDDLSDPYAP